MSDVSVDIIKNRNGEAPDLPSGANLSGVSTAATLQVTNLNPTHINASGVTTATTFSGSLKSTGTPTLGLGVTINSSGINISGVATAGIVSATTLYGDGSNLAGVAMSIAPISYNPDVNDTQVLAATGIGITFTERIIAGTGNVTLSIANAGVAGTVVENFGVGSSVTINNNQITIDPTSDLEVGETYHLSYPSGTFKNTGGDVSYVGTAYTFGVKPTFRELWVWGDNQYGQLGQNNNVKYSSPVQIPGNNWQGALVMKGGSGGTKLDGTLWSWGYNDYGNLGLNNTARHSSPTQIPGTTWTGTPVINTASYAFKTDGTLWVWGRNNKGQLGLNNNVHWTNGISSPVQLPGTTWSNTTGVTFGHYRDTVGAIKTDGTLWMWGYNESGQVGNNTVLPGDMGYSSPVQIPGTTWNILNVSDNKTFAIKTDNTLWVWGSNSNGTFGLNNQTQYSSPVQIPGSWSDITGSAAYGTMGLKTDGTVWGMGYNEQGDLGLNTSNRISSPVQIYGGGTTWNRVKGLSKPTMGTKTDGTLWAWGRNGYGQLGLNDSSFWGRSSPTQIPGTTWSLDNTGQGFYGNYGSFAFKLT